MKLYTEIDVKAIIIDFIKNDYILRHENMEASIGVIKPIELPSDEEVSKVATIVYGGEDAGIHDILQYKAFKRGAKYVINKLKEDNR